MHIYMVMKSAANCDQKIVEEDRGVTFRGVRVMSYVIDT